MTIRKATIEDGPALAKLRWDFSDQDEAFEAFAERFALCWADAVTSWTVWVAERERGIVSNMWLFPVPKVPRPGQRAKAYGYLTNVYTHPDERNSGIGAAMLERIVAWARDREFEAIYVSPSEESVSFYERCGFAWSKDWMEIVF